MTQMDKKQRNVIKQTFKNYRNMTSDVKRTLASVGIQAEKRKKPQIRNESCVGNLPYSFGRSEQGNENF